MLVSKVLFWGISVINLICTYYLNATVFPKRFSKRITLIVALIAMGVLFRFRYWLMMEGGQDKVPFSSSVVTISVFVLQAILFIGPWYRKIVTMILIEVFSAIAELVAAFVSEAIAGSYVLYDFSNFSFRLMVLLYYPAFAIILFVLIRMLKKVNGIKDEQGTRGYEWLVLAFPIAQLLLLYAFSGVTLVLTATGVVGMVLGCFADYYMIILLNRERTRKRLEIELQEEQRFLEQEERTFHRLEEDQEEIAKIRHDYQNQLMVLQNMMKSQKK